MIPKHADKSHRPMRAGGVERDAERDAGTSVLDEVPSARRHVERLAGAQPEHEDVEESDGFERRR